MGNTSAQTIFNDMVKHIKSRGGQYSDWYCGISNDPKRRLFDEHGLSKDKDKWCYKKCDNDSDARSVEKLLLNKGCKGDTGGGGTNSVYVYVFRKM